VSLHSYVKLPEGNGNYTNFRFINGNINLLFNQIDNNINIILTLLFPLFSPADQPSFSALRHLTGGTAPGDMLFTAVLGLCDGLLYEER
jgi:hypothetical protein